MKKKDVNTKKAASNDNKKKKIVAIIIAIIIIIILLLSLTCCQKKNDLGKLQGKVKQEKKKEVSKKKRKNNKSYDYVYESTNKSLAFDIIDLYYANDNSDSNNNAVEEKDTDAPVARVIYSNKDITNENVEITIIVSEKINAVEGWTLSEDGKTLTKTVSENEEGTVTITDLAGNATNVNYSVTNIDKTTPVATVSYDPNNATKQNVIVTIIADEEIACEDDSWTLSEDGKTLTKTVSENEEGTVTITDLAGNTIDVDYSVQNIDRQVPTLDVSLDITEITKEDVTVTITADEEIQEVEGWTLNGNTLTKVVSQNERGNVNVKDLAGNESSIRYEVTNIDKTNPTITGVNNNTEYQINVTPIITDENLDTVKLNGKDFASGTEIKKNGEYELIATDKAGNTTTINFIISKALPIINVNEQSKEIEYGSNYEIVNGIANNDVVVPSITYNNVLTNDINTENPGDYVLKYEYTDEDGNSAEPVVITITVKEAVMPEDIKILDESGADITANDVELYVGNTKQLTVNVIPENATYKEVTYSSNDESVVSVSENGLITAKKEGNTQITITSTKDSNVTKTINVKVSNILVTNIEVSASNTELTLGDTTTANAIITPTNATIKDVVWSSSDERIATVDENGRITAIGVGRVNIIATTTDGTNLSNSVLINVSVEELTETELASAIHTQRTIDEWGKKEDTITFGKDGIKIKKIGYVPIWSNLTTLNKSDFVKNGIYMSEYSVGLIKRNITWTEDSNVTLVFNNSATFQADNYYYIYVEGVRMVNGIEYGDLVSYIQRGNISRIFGE